MAKLDIDIKTSKLPDVEEAVAALHGYSDTLPNADGTTSPNPETKQQFLKRQVKAWLQNQLVEHKNRQALLSASSTDTTL